MGHTDEDVAGGDRWGRGGGQDVRPIAFLLITAWKKYNNYNKIYMKNLRIFKNILNAIPFIFTLFECKEEINYFGKISRR